MAINNKKIAISKKPVLINKNQNARNKNEKAVSKTQKRMNKKSEPQQEPSAPAGAQEPRTPTGAAEQALPEGRRTPRLERDVSAAVVAGVPVGAAPLRGHTRHHEGGARRDQAGGNGQLESGGSPGQVALEQGTEVRDPRGVHLQEEGGRGGGL